MQRKYIVWLCLSLFAVSCSLFPLGFAADTVPSDEPPPDPVPLRRVLLPPRRLAAEMERAAGNARAAAARNSRTA